MVHRDDRQGAWRQTEAGIREDGVHGLDLDSKSRLVLALVYVLCTKLSI